MKMDGLPDGLTAEEESLRRDASTFFKLDESMITDILNRSNPHGKPFAFQVQEWPDTLYACVQFVSEKISSDALLISNHINRALLDAKYGRAAQFLDFFQVRDWNFDGRLTRVDMFKFSAAFPFGCFYRRGNLPSRIVAFLDHWVYGQPDHRSIEFSLKIEESAFHKIYDCIRRWVYTEDLMLDILKSFSKDSWVIHSTRINQLLEILSQKRFASTKTAPYLFLLPLTQYGTCMTLPFKIPRPVWSRSTHQSLNLSNHCDSKFDLEAAVRTVLLMQKFRYAEFSLHKDLVDTIIRHLFDFYLDSLEDYLVQKREFMREAMLTSWSFRQSAEYCFDVGIVQPSYVIDWCSVEDAYDLKHGKTISPLKQKRHNRRLAHEIISWPGSKEAATHLYYKFHDVNGFEPGRGLAMIEYCKKSCISLKSIQSRENGRVLGEADFPGLIQIFQEILTTCNESKVGYSEYLRQRN
jgi:hypothetical protein